MARALTILFLLALAAPAAAHVERPAYFPDPGVDTSVKGGTGGKIPKARTLASALRKKPAGKTRVVCQRGSMKLLRASIRKARKDGYEIRPSDRRSLSRKKAKRLLKINKKLRKRCKFSEIQPAVTASGNNDRVVVMPGLYEEPTARAKPTNDTSCDKYRTNGDKPGEEGNALSYAYQFHCPNDQNLIAVLGREPGSGEDPIPPRSDRFGIPNLGKCIRCNFQIEGSGVSADDVIIEAGDASKGNGGPNGVGSKKDVGIRADRADGFVLRNITARHAGEHGIYVLEVDGYLLDRFKVYYSKLYGTLTFVTDHGRQQNCDGVGHGDSAVYPGAAPETGQQRQAGTRARLNQEIRWCDLHHNMSGYSGTNGNSVWIHHNKIYDNTLGFTTDVVTGAGHPGYPGDSMLIEDNEFYSNNFNIYAPDSDVEAAFPFPMGTGLWIAGGNNHTVRNNFFYDNWRRGTMVFSVPDALVCGPAANGNEQAGCDSTTTTTSHYNQQYDNKMGVRPDGTADRNGTDFWWDRFVGARGNCWYRNSNPGGITTSPANLPDCNDGRDPGSSIGFGSENEAELASCVAAFETRNFDPNGPCPWIKPPADPDGGASASAATMESLEWGGIKVEDPVGVPLGQMSCKHWNGARGDAGRLQVIRNVSGFAGGVVNDGSRDLGTGATLSETDAAALYDHWCGEPYAQEFLLYKLYTHAAAFTQR